jgi:ABC-type multidrug transport system ATPase subunit
MICKGLTKVYDNGKRATTDFNLIIEDNQAFGLLGPNGAGKTTLISMITGIFSPTSGSAHIAGYSIKEQIDKVHMHMGVCPQFDILWDELTVEEHLYFYARLRGVSAKMEGTKVK